MAIDANGHTGAPATIGAATFLSAASNGADVMSVGFTSYRPATATRIRRSGDAIETIEQDLLLTQSFSGVMTGATHSGVYFTVSLTTVGLAPVSAPAVAERPLLTFAAPQRAPALAADGDLHVVAWQEGSLLRAARLRGDTTLDLAGIDVVNFGPADGFQAATAGTHALAVNAGRTLIAWTEQGYNGGEAPILVPVRVVGRIVGADGTLAPSFPIDSISGHDSGLTLGGIVATSAGFAVLVGRGYSWRVVSVNAAGQLLGAKDLDLTAAFNPALTRRADGFLLAYTEPPKDDLVAVPVHADGTSAGSPQIIGGTAERANFPAVAGDGNGHVLAVWSENDRLLARPLDESGVPAGPAHDLGVAGALARVTWNGSAFVIVSGADVVLTALDGGVRSRQVWNGSLAVFQPGVAGDTITALHSGIDAGVGDTAVLFVTRFSSVVRRHAARP